MSSTFREVTKFSLLSGAEEAMIGWHWDHAGTAADIKTAIDAHFDNLWISWRPHVFATCVVVERELQEQDIATGHVLSVLPLNLPTDPSGSNSAGQPLPPQCSVVMSLRTASAGRSGRGRFYLPGLGTSQVSSTGRLISTERAGFVDPFKTYVDAVQTALVDGHLAVYSKKLGDNTDVVKVDMGDVIDTQRRRRNKLSESRYSVTI